MFCLELSLNTENLKDVKANNHYKMQTSKDVRRFLHRDQLF